MSRIRHININNVELRKGSEADPVAPKVKWDPVKPGGSNFKAQTMKSKHSVLRIQKSWQSMLFSLLFLIPPVIILFVVMPELRASGDTQGMLMLSLFSLAFAGVSLALWFLLGRPVTFDRAEGVYCRGKTYQRSASLPRKKQGRLSDIYALQIVSEFVRSSSSNGSSSSYHSYELNLVFEDGERVNVMDHGNARALEASAEQLAEFLDVHVWRGYVERA
uniref:hypothetical protein n=1 Tax=Thaumasiovibrio occultus TaxID=1891184 RepID=UPI000B35FE1B|nr:hypothetical protein [Thaumasiovibrio occultus]